MDKKTTVKIHGKEYETVASRVNRFRQDDQHKNLAIRTELITADEDYVVMKASIVDIVKNGTEATIGEFVLATGYAEEKRNSTNINKTSALENAECVPITTKILTNEGWKFYHQINPGDQVFGYNPNTQRIELQSLEKISIYKNQSVVKIENSRFSAICTPNHKWLVDNKLIPLNEINQNARITLTAPIAKHGGNIIAAQKLGWIFGDSTRRYLESGLIYKATITQSKEQHFQELEELFGEKISKKTKDRTLGNKTYQVLPHYKWDITSIELRNILGAFNVNHEDDLIKAILSMTFEELEAFVSSMMKSDGSNSTYSKTNKKLVETMRVAFLLLGKFPSKITIKKPTNLTTKNLYEVRAGTTQHKYISELKKSSLPPTTVWCPTTEFGNWIADFGEYCCITGNTSAIGRALAAFGYAGTEYASADEVANAVIQQTKSATPKAPALPPVENVDEETFKKLCFLGSKLDLSKEQSKKLWDTIRTKHGWTRGQYNAQTTKWQGTRIPGEAIRPIVEMFAIEAGQDAVTLLADFGVDSMSDGVFGKDLSEFSDEIF